MSTFSVVDEYFEQMFDLARRVHAALTQAEIEYRIVGGVAVFLHINELDPLAARLTRDVDVAIDRRDLDAVVATAGHHGFRYLTALGLTVSGQGARSISYSLVKRLGRTT